MEEDLDGVLFNIRAIIVSFKGGPIPLQNLTRDYETIVGSSIPYRKFNYSTIESFLQSFPSLRVSGRGRDVVVEAAPDRASSHISCMVSKQKPSKKKEPYPPRRGNYSTRGYRRGRGNYQPRNYMDRENSAQNRYSQVNTSLSSEFPQYKKEEDCGDAVEPLVVKIDGNEKRQVLMGDSSNSHKQLSSSHKDSRSKYKLPPRLQKMYQKEDATGVIPTVSSPGVTNFENLDGNVYQLNDVVNPGLTEYKSNSIISHLGPSELIAAGRAKQQAEQAQFDEYFLQRSTQSNNEFGEEVMGSLTQYIPEDSFQAESPVQFPLMLNVGLPSYSEVPVLKVAVPKPDQYIPNNVTLLLQYTMAKKWRVPEYKIVTRRPKGLPLQYTATIKIYDGPNIKTYKGYPYEDEDIHVAKGYAARIALESLLKEEEMNVDSKAISSDQKTICDRVRQIVEGYTCGVFLKSVEDIYMEKHKERLPENWVQALDSCPTLSVEPAVNSIIIVPKNPTVESVLSEKSESPKPPILQTPDEDIWDVYVTHATSSTGVWIRLIGENYSEMYEELLTNMHSYYSTIGSNEIALTIEDGQHYAVQTENTWFRVCISEVNDDTKKVVAWLIDNGETDEFSFSNLYRLHPDFCSLPKQALQCSLAGLESFGDDPYACEIITRSADLIGNSLVAKIKSRNKETGYTSLELFDTSGTDDVNINEKLQEDIICYKGDPVLPNEGCAMEVFINNISRRGEVFVMIPGPAADRIVDVLDRLDLDEINKHKLTSYRQVVLNKIYLAKFNKDSNWYRAVVTATPSVQQNKISIRFVDYGNTETVSITDIAEVDNLSPVLSKFPPQALKVALHHLPIESLSNSEIAKLHALLMDKEKIVLVKTVKLQEDPPIVEIFYKNDDNALVSVNNTIILYRPEENKSLKIQKTSYDLNSHKLNLDSYNNQNGDFYIGLSRPELDEDFMSIIVMLAASPGNFTFQPLKYIKELESLMTKMQAYYECAALPELTNKDIVKGGLYAAKYSDETWYRVVVTEAITGSNFPVRLCDFGDVVLVSISNMRDLEAEFRLVPFVGVKGKLAGIVPAHTDWSVEDCIRFQKLVVNKRLAAAIVNIEDNFVDPLEMVVGLHLVDTNSENDEVITEIMINEKRAVKKIS